MIAIPGNESEAVGFETDEMGEHVGLGGDRLGPDPASGCTRARFRDSIGRVSGPVGIPARRETFKRERTNG